MPTVGTMRTMSLLPSPWRLLASGMRRGNTALTVVGAALAVISIIRRLDGSGRDLVYSRRLSSGDRFVIGFVRPGERRRQRSL
jgi:hypothetical protein